MPSRQSQKDTFSKKTVCEHVGIFVRDMEKVSAFYCDHLGFDIIREYEVERAMIKAIFGVASRCRLRFMRRGDFGVELFLFLDRPLAKRTERHTGYDHWTLVVEDKARFCRRLKKRGIPVIRVRKPHGATYFIKDPENNMIEVKSRTLCV